MDWRDPTRKSITDRVTSTVRTSQGTSSGLPLQTHHTKSRPRRRSREESSRCRSAGSSEDRETANSSTCLKDRLECSTNNRRSEKRNVESVDDIVKFTKTNETQMTISREELLINQETLRNEDSGLEADSSISEDNTRSSSGIGGGKIATSSHDKWKEVNSTCTTSGTVESSCRRLKIDDLESPVSLERALNGCVSGDVSGSTTMYNFSTKSSSSSSGFYSTASCGNETENSNTQSVEMLLLRDEMSCNDEQLADLIGTLLVSVERKIERVNLDDLVFPCPACRNIDIDDPLLSCKCGAEGCECPGVGGDQCDCGIVTNSPHNETRSFEVAGIKHIDSDDEEEVRMGFGKS